MRRTVIGSRALIHLRADRLGEALAEVEAAMLLANGRPHEAISVLEPMPA